MKGIILRQDEVKELQVTGKVVLWRDIKTDKDWSYGAYSYDGNRGYAELSLVHNFDPVYSISIPCPYITQGEARYVKETFYVGHTYGTEYGGYPYESDELSGKLPKDNPKSQQIVLFPNTGVWVVYKVDDGYDDPNYGWRPSVHMPEWASRYIVKCTAVTVEKRGDVWQWGIELENATS